MLKAEWGKESEAAALRAVRKESSTNEEGTNLIQPCAIASQR
jgi:hypothetical protein